MTPRRDYSGLNGGQPGPGAYNVSKDGGEGAPKYGFGKSQRGQSARGPPPPGPGTYQADANSVLGGAAMYSMTPRRERVSRSLGPGPGQYRASTAPHQDAPKWGFGASSRERSTGNPGPGPGAYADSAKGAGMEGPKYSMQSRSKMGQQQARLSPGPGAYGASESNRTPKWGFGSAERSKDNSATANPGPGTYIISDKGTGNGYSMTPRRDASAAKNATPGPTQYEQSRKPVDARTPMYGFGCAKRAASNREEQPGPGTYEAGSHIGNGPKCGIRGRHRGRRASGGGGNIGIAYTQFGYVKPGDIELQSHLRGH